MPSRAPLQLDQFLCLDLYATSRAVMKAYAPLLEPLGLTYPQYLVMVALWAEDGRTVKALARALSLDSGTLSPLLKRLEGAGLLKRARSVDDERAMAVTLTPAGRALQRRAPEVVGRMGELFGLPPAQLQGLKQSLRKIQVRMESSLAGEAED